MEIAKPPFTAEQIRDATQAGRTYIYEVESQGHTITRRMLFREVTESSAKIESVTYGDDGTPVDDPATSEDTWDDLVGHASYPFEQTKVTQARCRVPAGKFDCMVYTVTDGAEVTVAKFAKSLPGAPVSLVIKNGDQTVMKMTLLDHRESYQARARFDHLWDFSDPAGTRAKFEARLPEAMTSGNAGYIAELKTQIARTYSLEQKFDECHALLDEVEKTLKDEQKVAKVRVLLERGRGFNSNGQKDLAVEQFTAAWELAQQTPADELTVDAAHMLGIAVPGEDGLAWTQKALAFAERSELPAARRWKGSLYNNIGWSYADKADYATAKSYFEKCQLFFFEEGKRPERERIARWSIAKMERLLGNVERALEMQQKILTELTAANETDGFVHEELAECLLALDRRQEATEHFAKAYEALAEDRWLQRDEPERLARLKKLGGVE